MYEVAQKMRREYGGDYILHTLYEKAKKQDKSAVIESIRTLGEIETLRKNKDIVLLGIDAPREIRYHRIVER